LLALLLLLAASGGHPSATCANCWSLLHDLSPRRPGAAAGANYRPRRRGDHRY